MASPPVVPGAVERAAGSAGLGPLRRAFVPRRLNWAAVVVLLVFGLAMVVVLVGFIMLWAVFRTPNLSRSVAARRLYLYEQGFVLVERPDDPQVFRWDGIDAVFQKIVIRGVFGFETARNYLYTVVRRDGRTAKLTDLWTDIKDLGPHINLAVSAALLPMATTAIERGQGVRFGDMTLTADRIAGKHRSVRWSEVSKVTIVNGYVRVNVAGRFLPLSATAGAKIPNLPLFLTLTERLRCNTGARTP